MTEQIIEISVAGEDPSQADLDAEALRQAILDAVPPGTTITRAPSDKEAMQFGEMLLIPIIAESIVIAIFRGIESFQHRRERRVPIRVKAAGETFIFDT